MHASSPPRRAPAPPTGPTEGPELTPALELAQRPSYPELARKSGATGNLTNWLLVDSRSYYQIVAQQLRFLLADEGELSVHVRDEQMFNAMHDNDWGDLYAHQAPAHPPPPPPVVPAGTPLAAATHLLDEHQDRVRPTRAADKEEEEEEGDAMEL